MSYVIAIDVGIKNLGLCVFDFKTAKVVEWDNVSLVPSGRYIPAQNVQYVREFVKKYDHYFYSAFRILIERQMRCNMRIIEAVVQAMFFDICTVISARSVKIHYDLSTRNYRLNKHRAVQWAKEFVHNNPTAFMPGLTNRAFSTAPKQDDLADSLLLLMYYLDTYSNQLNTGVPEFLYV